MLKLKPHQLHIEVTLIADGDPKQSDVKENLQEIKRWQKLAGIIK